MKLPLLATLCLLTACQSGHYADFSGEHPATLVFSSDDLTAQPVICVPGKGLTNTGQAVGRAGYKLLDDLNEAMNKSPEVRVTIPGNSTVIAGFRHSQRGRSEARRLCLRTVSLDSVAGETYRLQLEKSPACAIRAFRRDGDDWVEQPVETSAGSCP